MKGCLYVIGGFVLLVFLAAIFGSHTSTSSPDAASTQQADSGSASDATADATDAPTPKPAKTAKPESYAQQRQREKHEFYDSVDQSVTAAKIAGNPSKYVGYHVELHCTVSNVPQEGMINASCGDDATNIVLQYDDTGAVDQGQAIRVLGEVAEPMEGTNAMGGSMNFPAVKVEFMQ